MRLVTTWFGVFLEEDGQIVEKVLFPQDADEIARRMLAVENGEILAEEEELAGGKQLVVSEERLEMLGDFIPEGAPFIAPEDHGFPIDLLNKAMISIGKDKVRASGRPDEQILQAIRAIDDLNKTANLLSERLHEWHEINFPELAKLVPEDRFVKLVAEHGDRKAILDSAELDISDSMGSEISSEDAAAMQKMAVTLQQTMKSREELDRYVQGRMKEVAKNTSHVIGPLIGARLISLAGGLERLAKMPSSTVQILGAEKAFFKHLKDHTKPPKHGIIFQHPNIHRAPYWQRGKISRAMASKISIAVKMDFYGDEFIGDELEAKLEKRLEEIRKKYPNPPRK